MAYLLDTGILLRLINRADQEHVLIRKALVDLRRNGHALVTTFQNLTEFWNVCTRPSTARGGYGFSTALTERKLRIIERVATLLPDSPAAYPIWRQLVCDNSVAGAKVHDAKLVALMLVHGIENLLTMNPSDFSRYKTISVTTPESLTRNAT